MQKSDEQGVYPLYQIFFEELSSKLYPSTLLHSFGVNGKISGSVSAIGEMGDGIVGIIHGPMGCAYHYRYSVRRRHQPFYALLSSDLTEQDIVFGGEEKLRQAVLAAWERCHPRWIFIIPTPVSDVLNEDIQSVAAQLRREGLPVTAIQSELFSHRDKNFNRNRLKELSLKKITGDNRLELELKGCGFTEALYSLVEQVMQPTEKRQRSINIETINWGSEGRLVLREMEEFLGRCGVTVNCWIPSSDMDRLAAAPAAELNLVRRVRWARRMKEKFGTDYIHIGSGGRYVGLEGIATLYRDIGQKLDISQQMDELVAQETARALADTAESRAALSQYRCALVCRGMQSAPFTVKLYAREFGVQISSVCVILTDDLRRNMGYTPEVEARMTARIQDAIDLYAPGAALVCNPSREELQAIFTASDAVVGTDDVTLEGLGAPLIPASSLTYSLSFPSYVRNLHRLRRRLENRGERDLLLLNRMSFSTEHYPRYNDRNALAAREMWRRMWLERKEEQL